MPKIRESILVTVAIDLGAVPALGVLWARPLGPESDQDWPTFIVAMVVQLVVSMAALTLLERRLPAFQGTRPGAQGGRIIDRKPRMIRAGWVVGFIALLIAEVATGFSGRAGFAVFVGIVALANVWLPTEALGRRVSAD